MTRDPAQQRDGLPHADSVTPTLTLLGEDRLAEYRTLLHRAYAQNARHGVHFAASTASAETVRRHLRENLAYGWEGEDGRLLGSISLRLPWGPNPGHLGLPHIGWLAADPDRAPRGTGARLLEALVEQVLRPQLHAPAVSLGTAADHPWLGTYYLRHGFAHVGSADLGLGHVTDFYVRPLDRAAYTGWRTRHAALLEGLTS